MPLTTYVDMSNKEYDRLSGLVRASYPNSCIVWIEENLNPTLRQSYERRKDAIAAECNGDPKEAQMFHGTREENINTISSGGFDPSMNKVAVYGLGTYFARDAAYSFNYMWPGKEQISYMFLCDVVLGKSTIGASSKLCPTGYHSQVNTLPDPTIVSVPFPDSAYPKYIIAFHKSAK